MAGIGSTRKVPVGNMRHRISVRSATTTVDAARQKVITYTTTRYASEPASFEEVSGGEYLRGRQIEAGVVAVFIVNYRDGYEVTDRVTFQGTNYGIHRIHNPSGIGRFLEIHCKAAPV